MAYARKTHGDFVPALGQHWISTTKGLSGHFAVEMWASNESPGLVEPYDSGIGRYATEQEAAEEAVMWADEYEVPCVLSQAEWDGLKAKGLVK